MIKKALLCMILFVSCSVMYAHNQAHDDQKQIVERLKKKLLRVQASHKNNQLVLDEIAREVVAEFDDSHEELSKDTNSNTALVVSGIVVGCLALGIGGYLLYKHFQSKKLTPQQNQDINTLLSGFPLEIRASVREAIRNGSDENLVNFINEAENAIQTRDPQRRLNFLNSFVPVIAEGLTPQQLIILEQLD